MNRFVPNHPSPPPLPIRGAPTDPEAVPYGERADLPALLPPQGAHSPNSRWRVRVVHRPPSLAALLTSSALAAVLAMGGVSWLSGSGTNWVSEELAALQTLWSAAPAQAQPVPTPRQIYSVERGDTLSGIAAKLWQDPRAWPRLLDANRDRLRDPERLEIGVELVIPDGPT